MPFKNPAIQTTVEAIAQALDLELQQAEREVIETSEAIKAVIEAMPHLDLGYPAAFLALSMIKSDTLDFSSFELVQEKPSPSSSPPPAPKLTQESAVFVLTAVLAQFDPLQRDQILAAVMRNLNSLQ